MCLGRLGALGLLVFSQLLFVILEHEFVFVKGEFTSLHSSSYNAASEKVLGERQAHGSSKEEPQWLNQKLDHFAPIDNRTFGQRYYENLDHFKEPDGPIFLLICGEDTCEGTGNDYLHVLAKEFGGAVVALEHRYYGYSYPFDDLSTESLRFLSSGQALADLAVFREHYQGLLNERYKRGDAEDNAWIVVGISYAGALSAWFRLKYPHLVRGSLSSSGDIHMYLTFPESDIQVAKSAGKRCTRALQEVTRRVERGLEGDAVSTKQRFDAEKMENDDDFLYMLADVTVLTMQYGLVDTLCEPLVDAHQRDGDVVGVMAEYVREFWYDNFGTKAADYNRRSLTSITPGPVSGGQRQWWYQTCTEFGCYEVAPEEGSVRSTRINLEYHQDICTYLFGEGVVPTPKATNRAYGGKHIRGTRIFFTNGSQDPWKLTSKLTSSPHETAFVMKCHDCGHGTDFRGCPQWPNRPHGDATKCAKPEEVYEARREMMKHVAAWIEDEDYPKDLASIV